MGKAIGHGGTARIESLAETRRTRSLKTKMRREDEVIRRIAIRGNYNEILRRRSALAITETELKLMAALARIGLSSQPKMG
jgi:hypothetical protein